MKQIAGHLWNLNERLGVIYPHIDHYDLWHEDPAHYADTWLEHNKLIHMWRMCTYHHQLPWYPTDDEAIDSYIALKVARRLDAAQQTN